MTGTKLKTRPTVYGVATIGKGIYKSGCSRKKTKQYQTWFDMIRRCYDPKNRVYARYGGRGVTVCDEWLDFQNFATWYISNYKEGFKLDKDLTNIGSMQYSPDNCSFIPVEVNNLLISSNACRGKHPIGVSFSHNKYLAECWDGNKKKHYLGKYKCPNEAFGVYRSFKRNIIDEVASYHYKEGNISKEIYTNLINWEIVPYPE